MAVDVKLFMSFFDGRKDAWGGVEGVQFKEPVTEENYRLHLEGKTSLGIYPLLDDGTINFFAIDLDEKIWEKAIQIRQELTDLGLNVYIAESKGKGYHIYGFADGQIQARDIRIVLNGVLAKLKIKAEVFPKQDKLDEKIPYGNYINLPCFGGNKRLFQTVNHQALPPEQALPRIKRNTLEAVLKAAQVFPPPKPKPAEAIKEKKTPVKGKTKHPPCVEQMLKGVGSGMRDEAAFALARHYLDQGYYVDEVTVLLEQWDTRNKPPLGDEKILRTKAESAGKGYAFGCASVKDGLLSSFCVGEDHCIWLTEATKDKKKRGLIREVSFFETPEAMYEQVSSPDNKQTMFLGYNYKTQQLNTYKEIQDGEITYIPIDCEEIKEDAVRLPTGFEDYGNTIALHERLMEHMKRYVDIQPKFLEFVTWYILMTWVYDKLPTLSYARFTGDTGVGKSRSLDTIGDLCYKPMVLSGAITPAPIYRLIRKFRGTLILDEADFQVSDEKAEVIKILNSGFERGRPVIRCMPDNPDDLQVLPTFGPKVFATRNRFQDIALEARCLTYTLTETTRDDIPPYLNSDYHKRVIRLRNQLLLWRFKTRNKIDPDSLGADMDMPNGRRLEPRLKQTSVPFSMVFAELPETVDRFRQFMHEYNQEIIQERFDSAQGGIIWAMFKAADTMGKKYVTAGAIAKIANEEKELEIKARKVASIMKSLSIKTDKRRLAGKQGRYLEWDDVIMSKIYRRYMPTDEFAYLFDPNYQEPNHDPAPEEPMQETEQQGWLDK